MSDDDVATRVLVVEDDPVTQRVTVRLLRQLGFETAVASTAREAIEKLSAGPRPRFVILDLVLREGSGLDVLREIRERQFPVKVAVVTGSVEELPPAHFTPLRPDAVFIKPFNPSDLIGWLGSPPADGNELS